MDKITEKVAALPPDANYFSLEFFPPKTQAGFNNLQSRLARMAHSLRPLFVNVTWGAGGSTASKSLELAEICQRQLGLTTCLHLTCTNSTQRVVDEALEGCRELGVRNILALRGDAPREGEYREAEMDGEDGKVEEKEDQMQFVWAADLVRYIRQKHGDYFCIGVAGYPEGHADESHPTDQSVSQDLPYLVEKVQAGADFIMTQLTYDIDAYADYEQKVKSCQGGTLKDVPIVTGLMPVQSWQILNRITKLSHAKVPRVIQERFERVKTDDDAVKKVGVDVLSEIVEAMKEMSSTGSGGRRGFHFYTLNLEKSVAFILERTGLIPASRDQTPEEDENAIGDSEGDSPAELTNGSDGKKRTGTPQRISKRRTSSVNAQPHNRIIVDAGSRSPKQTKDQPHQNGTAETGLRPKHEAPERGTGIPAANPTRKNDLLISEGQGSLGREATWDDFPNGRWGPSHSPAFGEIDGYGPSLKVGPVTVRKLWGRPRRTADITEIFKRHVCGEVACVPWSDDVSEGFDAAGGGGALKAETETIKKQLLGLIDKNFWTVASQPAVNGVKSDDPTFGWGPPGEGFVFQKAFVEFFCARSEWEKLRSRLMSLAEDETSWLVTDAQGQLESSEEARAQMNPESGKKSFVKAPVGTTGFNAVTWGVFRGKEIVTPTIIEKDSFRAWGEKAFEIWDEWRTVFPRGSEEELFLKRCRDEVVLVNIVGQRFVGDEGGRLWEILGVE